MRSDLLGRIPATFMDAWIAGFGIWSLYGICNVYLGCNFDQLVSGLWIPALLASLFLVPLLRRGNANSDPAPVEASAGSLSWIPLLTLLLAGVCLMGWYMGRLPYQVAWVAALLHLASLFRRGEMASPARAFIRPPRAEGRDGLALALVCVAALVATLGINRPDADDAYYLNVIISALDHPELPVLSFDGMHGDTSAPIQEFASRPQTYELLLAASARLTGLAPDALYYVIFPALFAVSFALAQWLLLKLIHPRAAWLGVALVFLALLCWGDGHRTFGNFAFVRLFQGKGAFVCVFVPLIVYYALRFSGAPSVMNWLLLTLAQCGAVALTSSALFIAPGCMGLVLLSCANPTRRGLTRLAMGGLSCLPLFVTLLLVRTESLQAAPRGAEGFLRDLTSIIGASWRAPLSLFAVLSLPWLARRTGLPSAPWTTRYVGLAFLLILNGVTGPLLAKWVAQLFSWRIYWVLPIPLLAACAFASASLLRTEGRSWRRPGIGLASAALAALGFLLFLSAGPWTLAAENGASWEWAKPKRQAREYEVARRIVEMAPPGSTVLAPEPIAGLLTLFRDGPRLVSVYERYLANLSGHWGTSESLKRESLAKFVMGHLPPPETRDVLQEMNERCVNVFATFSALSERPYIHEGLKQGGFEEHDAGHYVIWIREMNLATCATSPHESPPQGAR
jgi:hypothetical protein